MSARDALIASVTGLVRRRGVAGTGLSALLEDSGVARRTVYLNFPGGKEELIAEATRESGQALTAVIQSAGDDPAVAIQAFIGGWKAALSESELEAGCPIVAAILGRSDAPAAADVAAAAVNEWQTIIADRLAAAGVDAGNARSLASLTIAAIEGAVILAQASQSAEPLDHVGHHLIETIKSYLPG
jgi:TetR/AcrR family transcriptional regulator, lmrAB and yxaGH operons repressor